MNPNYDDGYDDGYECVAAIAIPLDFLAAWHYVQGYIDGTLKRIQENSGDYLTF